MANNTRHYSSLFCPLHTPMRSPRNGNIHPAMPPCESTLQCSPAIHPAMPPCQVPSARGLLLRSLTRCSARSPPFLPTQVITANPTRSAYGRSHPSSRIASSHSAPFPFRCNRFHPHTKSTHTNGAARAKCQGCGSNLSTHTHPDYPPTRASCRSGRKVFRPDLHEALSPPCIIPSRSKQGANNTRPHLAPPLAPKPTR